MPKFRKKPMPVEAEVWREGLEDGWEYEDRLTVDISPQMYAASKVDGVRLYPYIATLEGRYYIGAGDWIITGQAGERWPVSDEKFRAIYDLRDDGTVVSKPSVREAIRMPNAFTIHCSGGDLRGEAGSYLVLATPDDAYPIAASIFAATYEPAEG